MLGPIVGHVTSTSARLWLQGADVDELAYRVGNGDWQKLAVRPKAEISNVTVADLTGLAPGTDYQYTFRRGGQDVESARGQFSTFREAPDRFSFMLGSCHKATEASPPGDWDTWSAMADALWATDMLILCGDQVYEGDIADAGKTNVDGPTLFAKREKLYRAAWNHQRFREVTAFIPTYMMWDDHDIRDDWGSRPADWTGPFEQRLFATADEAYQRYQNAHNPPGYRGARHYGFTIGRLAFYFLDLRGQRGKDPEYPILGKEQFNDFVTWASGVAGKADLLFLVSPVPIAHASVHAAHAARALGISLDVDLADAWNDARNVKDLNRVLDTLFHLQSEGMVRRCFVLGGDVHVATCTEILSDHPQHRASPVIHQFTSSPLSNSPPSWIMSVASGLFIRGEVALAPGYRSVNKRFLTRRNFGRVSAARAQNGQWTVDLSLSGQGPGVLGPVARIVC